MGGVSRAEIKETYWKGGKSIDGETRTQPSCQATNPSLSPLIGPLASPQQKVSPLQRREFSPEGAGLRPPAALSTLAALIAVHFPNNGPICPYAGGYQLNFNDLRYTKSFYRKIHRENDSGPQRD